MSYLKENLRWREKWLVTVYSEIERCTADLKLFAPYATKARKGATNNDEYYIHQESEAQDGIEIWEKNKQGTESEIEELKEEIQNLIEKIQAIEEAISCFTAISSD